jgi:hypothetical protein
MKIIPIFLIALTVCTATLACWFDPRPLDSYGKVVITMANTYETLQKLYEGLIFSTNNSIIALEFFDAGDTNADITADNGGNTNDTFACVWPVTFYVWFQTNTWQGGGYKQAVIQYFEGTNTEELTSWTTMYTITNFTTVNGTEGAHFGLVTWYPPKTNNVHYLIRVWAQLSNNWQNARLNVSNIDKDGSFDPIDWNDSEVLLIKTIPVQKPGSRNPYTSVLLYRFDEVAKEMMEKRQSIRSKLRSDIPRSDGRLEISSIIQPNRFNAEAADYDN